MSILPSATRLIGPRLIRLGEPCEDAAAEAAQLRELLVSAPRVEAVREICPHLKGGYVVQARLLDGQV